MLKLLEKNIGTTLQDTGVSKNFLNRTPTAPRTGSDKQDQVSTDGPHENQNLNRKGSKQQNTQPTGWEKNL